MRKTKKEHPKLTHELLLAKVHYDPVTGAFTWLASKYQPSLVGKPAGWKDQLGYLHIEVFGRRYKASRLAWFYVTGEWPTGEIDHRDRDAGNNKWDNLRPATRALNNVNRERQRRIPLPRGVHRNKHGFMARVGVGGKSIYLGTFPTPEEASQAYQIAASAEYGEFLPA